MQSVCSSMEPIRIIVPMQPTTRRANIEQYLLFAKANSQELLLIVNNYNN